MLALGVTFSLRAGAADLPATYCPLDRAPALSWLRLANGDDCEFDEDGNGLDDVVETQLASCFVPELVFDSRENALRVDEPHVFFSASPLGSHAVRLRFAFLFARDGGYVMGTEFPCMTDDHDGDVESVEVDVAWAGRDGGWFGAPVAMRTRDPRDDAERIATAPGTSNAMALRGTHPVLYATAGKHHWLHRPEALAYACNCGPLGRCGSVRDRADGAGLRVVPHPLRHAPGFYVERGKVRSQVPLDEHGGGFWNACMLGARNVFARAIRSLGSNDLGQLGYPGERLFGSCFRGGFGGRCSVAVSVAEALSWDKPFVTALGARKLVTVLLGGAADPTFTRTTVLLPFGAAPQRVWRN
jgi:hypothetical protein